MEKLPIIKAFLDTRRKKQNGLFPVKNRITYNRERKYYSTPLELTESDFEKITTAKRRNETETGYITLIDHSKTLQTDHPKLIIFSRVNKELFG